MGPGCFPPRIAACRHEELLTHTAHCSGLPSDEMCRLSWLHAGSTWEHLRPSRRIGKLIRDGPPGEQAMPGSRTGACVAVVLPCFACSNCARRGVQQSSMSKLARQRANE